MRKNAFLCKDKIKRFNLSREETTTYAWSSARIVVDVEFTLCQIHLVSESHFILILFSNDHNSTLEAAHQVKRPPVLFLCSVGIIQVISEVDTLLSCLENEVHHPS